MTEPALKVFSATLATETNTFAPMPTGLDAFEERGCYPAGTHPDAPTLFTGPLWAARLRARALGLTLDFEGDIDPKTRRLNPTTAEGEAELTIDNCQIVGSGKNGVALERSGGRIERSEISGSADSGIYSVEGTGLQITANTVSDCANGGILVHRWQPADDGTIVSANRVSRIAARNGGTGQYGNGINVYQAHGVVVASNRIADCAFTAVRANGSDNVQIVGNNCTRLGEVGIYSEFVFLGAVIANNVVDTAATGVSIANFLDGIRGRAQLNSEIAEGQTSTLLCPSGASQ